MADHHAFSYFADYNTLAIPVYPNGFESQSFGITSAPFLEAGNTQGVRLLKIDPEDGISELGHISHDSRVSRTIRIEDLVYTISTDTIKVNEILEPQNQVAELDYLTENTEVPVFLWEHKVSGDPMDVNGDGAVSNMDVLMVINAFNQYGASPTTSKLDSGVNKLSLSRPADAEGEADRIQVNRFVMTKEASKDVVASSLDTSGDGMLTPLDILLIINHRNRQAAEHVRAVDTLFEDLG